RAISEFATFGSATTTAILLWLTAQAAGEAAQPTGAPADGGDNSDAATTAADSQAGKTSTTGDAGAAAASEGGSRSSSSDSVTRGADDSRSDAATNGMSTAADHNGAHASVGSSTNPAILFVEQTPRAVTPTLPSVMAPDAAGAAAGNNAGNGGYDRGAKASAGGTTDGPLIVVPTVGD